MNFKIELKQNLEASICKGDQPIINCETIKSKLTFSSDDNLTAKPTTTQKNFKFIFAKTAYFMLSLIMGVFIGGGIMYSIKDTKSPVIGTTNDFDYSTPLIRKNNLYIDFKLNIILECISYAPGTTFKNLLEANIIDNENIKTIERVTINRNNEVEYEKINEDISFGIVNLVFYKNSNTDYLYILTQTENELTRYRLESNLPYTTEELKLSFENKIGETLTKEFLNAENTGIFAQLKYDAYTRKYYLEHELKYNDMTYIAQYDSIQEKLVVKSLI